MAGRRGSRRRGVGSRGYPASPNVHEVTQKVDSAARVLSIDYDPVVHAYANAYCPVCPE
ncbi:SAM-dependent methyltransferase [Nocardia terpenica]|uniref:SAM-dependent methyltransferase n=1 Tax=Nocardia terpenica TaxID=455432 RepID=UPI0038CDA511